MAKIFKKKSKKLKTNEEIIENDNEAEEVQFSLHSNEGGRLSELHKDYMQKEIDELPPIKKGEINITGIYIYDEEDKFEVKVYIRNGYMCSVNFDQIPLMIVDKKGEVLARQVFDLKDLGNIPPNAAIPWKLYFDKSNVNVESFGQDDWQIVFDQQLKVIRNINTVFEGIPDTLDENSRNQLEEYLNSLPILREGDLNISTFFVGLNESGGILIVFVIRNGVNQDVTLNQIPVSVKDNDGKLVAGGIFDTNLTVGSHKAKVCNLEFAPENVSKGDVNLNDLHVYFEFDRNATLESKVEQQV